MYDHAQHLTGATVAGSVIGAVVLLIILGVIIVVILGIAYVIRKRKKTFADQPDGSLTDDIVRMPKEKEVVGGHMSFKSEAPSVDTITSRFDVCSVFIMVATIRVPDQAL